MTRSLLGKGEGRERNEKEKEKNVTYIRHRDSCVLPTQKQNKQVYDKTETRIRSVQLDNWKANGFNRRTQKELGGASREVRAYLSTWPSKER